MNNMLIKIFYRLYSYYRASLMAQQVKNPHLQCKRCRRHGFNSLEKEMATHSSVLAWEIPRTKEPGGLQSTGLQRDRHNLVTKQQLVEFIYISALGKYQSALLFPRWF